MSKTVKDNAYYEILLVDSQATAGEIRKAYYVQAMRFHPDKNPDNQEAEEMFKKISQAYQVLSNPELRSRYDKFGLAAIQPEGGFMNPSEFFNMMFGGGKFVNIIGEIALGKILGDMIQESSTAPVGPDGKPKLDLKLSKESMDEQMAIAEKRISKLVQNLKEKIAPFIEDNLNAEEFTAKILKEALELREESFGVELLQSIGYIYSVKAKQALVRENFMGFIPSFFNSMKDAGHVVSEVWSTYGAVKDMCIELEKANSNQSSPKSSTTSVESAEDRCERKLKNVLWKASSLEVETTLRDVVSRIVREAGVPKKTLIKRAVAIKMIGDIYKRAESDEDLKKITKLSIKSN